jgi:hypothetical protein
MIFLPCEERIDRDRVRGSRQCASAHLATDDECGVAAIESPAACERCRYMKRLAVLLAIGACSPSRPSTDERVAAPVNTNVQQPQVAPPQQPPVAPPQQPAAPTTLSSDELQQQLRELGRQRGTALRAASDPGEGAIPALGPCQRPSLAERDALRTRVLAWIEKTTASSERPTDEPGQLALRFGCVEPAGIVITAQMDRETKQRVRTGPDVGHWWTLRAAKDAIAVLSETRGIATLRYSAYVLKVTEEPIALADLDGDGALDPLLVRTSREGLAMHADLQLAAVPSRTNKRAVVAAFGDEVALARVQPAARSGPVVLEISDWSIGVHAFRCVDAKLALVRCREAAAARRGSAALALADDLAKLSGNPDREQLAGWLELLEVPRDTAAPLLAAASATTPAERASRKIARAFHPDDDRTNVEHEAAARRDAAAAIAALRRDLGSAACDPTAPAADTAVRGAILAAAPGAVELVVRGRCTGPAGTYVAAAWRVRDQRSEGVFFVTGEQVTQVIKAGPAPRFDPSKPTEPLLQSGFYRGGSATIALVVAAAREPRPAELTALADGRAIGRRTGDLTIDGEVLARLQPADGGTGPRRYLHATETAIIEVAAFESPAVRSAAPAGAGATAAAKRLFAREQKLAARDLLDTATPQALSDPAKRADFVRALELVGAERALVEEAARVP